MAILGPTAKFNSHQYFQLYGNIMCTRYYNYVGSSLELWTRECLLLIWSFSLIAVVKAEIVSAHCMLDISLLLWHYSCSARVEGSSLHLLISAVLRWIWQLRWHQCGLQEPLWNWSGEDQLILWGHPTDCPRSHLCGGIPWWWNYATSAVGHRWLNSCLLPRPEWSDETAQPQGTAASVSECSRSLLQCSCKFLCDNRWWIVLIILRHKAFYNWLNF